MSLSRFSAIIDYEDQYVQPLIVNAIETNLPKGSYDLVLAVPRITSNGVPLLQIRAYEGIDFAHGLEHKYSLFNAYIIRKALIRKHYLSNTIFSWVTKNPTSCLREHFKPAVDFELDYAEFLDDALVEAFELHEAFESNAGKDPSERSWWILKPGMSDRGQGIRLFSTYEDLQIIFEAWEADNPDDSSGSATSDADTETAANDADASQTQSSNGTTSGDYIVTSHLRHFIAQPYIHPPLLFPKAPFSDRKFHIRTYVVAAGALRVLVYSHMLALFASEPYAPPWETSTTSFNAGIATREADKGESDALLRRMRNIHLTNTCIQTPSSSTPSASPSAVHLLSTLPIPPATHTSLINQIHSTTAELFRAALAHPTNFQPLPQAFEVFGVDFLVDAAGAVWLLEVNAFPDFAQTGEGLQNVVVGGLWREIVREIVRPWCGVVDDGERDEGVEGEGKLCEVLKMDLGRG